MPQFDARKLRMLLAEHRISHTRFAQVAGISRAYLSTLLTEHTPAGQLVTFKVHFGLRRLGLDGEVRDDAA